MLSMNFPHGLLVLWRLCCNIVQRRLEGHYGDVYTCRFFPSGVVILSGGADTQLKIWSAETGQCAATLVGHSAGIVTLRNNGCVAFKQ